MSDDVITAAEQESFIRRLRKTDEERLRIRDFQDWLASRVGLMTGSIAGAAAGHNPFLSHMKLLVQLLLNSFTGNEATKWGTENEPNGVAKYLEFRSGDKFTLSHTGLCIHPEFPWLACSPDGIVVEEDGTRVLLEIKCPFKKQLYPSIPKYYYDQIQYSMWLLDCKFCDFVVYTPTETSVERFAFDAAYVSQFLLIAINNFYFDKYLPRLVAREKGLLAPDSIQLPWFVKIERYRPSAACAA